LVNFKATASELLLVGSGSPEVTCADPDPGVPVIVTIVTEGAEKVDGIIEETVGITDEEGADDEARVADKEEEEEAPEDPPAAADN